MAILIPSKNIYGTIENPKIRNNIITKINVEERVISPDIQTEITVANSRQSDFTISGSLRPSIKNLTNTTANALQEYRQVMNATESKILVNQSTYYIDVYKQNSLSSIITYLNKEEISASISFKKTAYRYNTTYTPNTNSFDYSRITTENDVIEEETSLSYAYAFDVTESDIDKQDKVDIRKFSFNVWDNKITAKITTSFFELGYGGGAITNDTENTLELNNFDVSFQEHEDYFSANIFSVPSHIEATLLYSTPVQEKGDNDWLNKSYSAMGYKIVFEPIYIEFSFKGNTVGISLEKNTLSFGDGNTPYSINGSEILQNGGLRNGNLISHSIADNVLLHYKNGKETAVFKCSISDYFDEMGELAISADGKVGATPDRMTFQNGDEVIPMVCGADGKDRPLSQKNGLSKVFKVLGVKCFYDGAVWQEISLQEV